MLWCVLKLFVLFTLATLPAPLITKQDTESEIFSFFFCKQHLSMRLKQHCWHNSLASVAWNLLHLWVVFCHLALTPYLCILCNVFGDGSVYISRQTWYFTGACLDQTAMNSKNLDHNVRVCCAKLSHIFICQKQKKAL